MFTHVKQFGSQVLHILLSETSPNSFELEQPVAHNLVSLFPNRGLGQAITQDDPDLYRGKPQVKQLFAFVMQVAHVASHGLHILSFERSSNSVGLVHAVTQVKEERNLGAGQLVQWVEFDSHFKQLASQLLHILFIGSPYSFEFAKKIGIAISSSVVPPKWSRAHQMATSLMKISSRIASQAGSG